MNTTTEGNQQPAKRPCRECGENDFHALVCPLNEGLMGSSPVSDSERVPEPVSTHEYDPGAGDVTCGCPCHAHKDFGRMAQATAESDDRLPPWADPNCGSCGGSGYTSLGRCYVCQKRAAESLGVEAQKCLKCGATEGLDNGQCIEILGVECEFAAPTSPQDSQKSIRADDTNRCVKCGHHVEDWNSETGKCEYREEIAWCGCRCRFPPANSPAASVQVGPELPEDWTIECADWIVRGQLSAASKVPLGECLKLMVMPIARIISRAAARATPTLTEPSVEQCLSEAVELFPHADIEVTARAASWSPEYVNMGDRSLEEVEPRRYDSPLCRIEIDGCGFSGTTLASAIAAAREFAASKEKEK